MVTIDSPSMNALFHPEIKARLSKIAKRHDIQIKVVSSSSSEPEIQLIGSIDDIEVARVEVLCQMDLLCDMHMETIETIPSFLHNIIAGRRHTQLHSIMEETSTNVYLQSPFSHVCKERKQDSNLICLTGQSKSELLKAKELLTKLSSQKLKSFYQKDLTMAANKIDWLLLFKRSQLRKIMMDNGSFFSFPILGATSNTVSVYAENRVNVERSIRLLNQLITVLYDASFELSPRSLKDVNMSLCLGKLSKSTGVTASYFDDNHVISLFGTEKQVKHTYQLLAKIPFFKESQKFTSFRLELATDQLEFISGKKNGKINKIMKACVVNIRFVAVNEYNSSIFIESTHYKSAFEGLLLLQDELPAEVSFYVPEIYHRRIIGVGGKNIQKVMKKYGVYVKFSGAEELASLGGYFENEDNVVARTPMKNQVNLENLKQTVTDFVGFEKDRDYVSQPFTIPFTLQRTLLEHHDSELHEVCHSHNVKIRWPERLGTSHAEIYGPQSHISAVSLFLSSIVKVEQHLVIAYAEEFGKTVSEDLVTQLRKDLSGLEDSVYLIDVLVLQQKQYQFHSKQLEFSWISHAGEKYVVFRMLGSLASKQHFEKTKSIIQSRLEAHNLPFTELKSNSTLLESDQGSNEGTYKSMFNNTEVPKKETQVSSNLKQLPRSQSCYEPALHPLEMPRTKSFCTTTNSFLSMPVHNHRNIWASAQASVKHNSLPMLPIDSIPLSQFNMHSAFPVQPHHPFSPMADEAMTENGYHPQSRAKSSVPTIGTRHQDPFPEQYLSHQQYPQRHSSWPNIFLGGRDLFDTLPSRRASSINTTQYAFEHQPNSCSFLQHHKKAHGLSPSSSPMHIDTMMLPAINSFEHRYQDPSGFNI
ncbi:hypothetical protein A0J61_09148 [Choanephora cucurbitarum]|uniref:K Homology domain-containing protein n=1 Tax=Choanephora cucurbitarum TaxID=101091 RepID=A0A1C7N155_9FUNG|nr:hypothetical protein A0J61_09148 [Choanephora cucurbitarum]